MVHHHFATEFHNLLVCCIVLSLCVSVALSCPGVALVNLAGSPTVTICTDLLVGVPAGPIAVDFEAAGVAAQPYDNCISRVDNANGKTTCYLARVPKNDGKLLLRGTTNVIAHLSWPAWRAPDMLIGIVELKTLGTISTVILTDYNVALPPNAVGLIIGTNCIRRVVPFTNPTSFPNSLLIPMPVVGPACPTVQNGDPIRMEYIEYEGHADGVENDRRLTYQNFPLGVYTKGTFAIRDCSNVVVADTETLIDICGSHLPMESLSWVTLESTSTPGVTYKCYIVHASFVAANPAGNLPEMTQCVIQHTVDPAPPLQLPLKIISLQLDNDFAHFTITLPVAEQKVVASSPPLSPPNPPPPPPALKVPPCSPLINTDTTVNHPIVASTNKVKIDGTCLVLRPAQAGQPARLAAVSVTVRDSRPDPAPIVTDVVFRASHVTVYYEHLRPLRLQDYVQVTFAMGATTSAKVTFEVQSRGASLRCLRPGDDSEDNGWWMTYKHRLRQGYFWGDAKNIASGLKYEYKDFFSSPVIYTMQQLYPLAHVGDEVNYIIYNEQWGSNGYSHSKKKNCGHMKGAIAWNAQGKGFWITHSFPDFPLVEDQDDPKYPEPKKGQPVGRLKAQHFLCVPIASQTDLEQILSALGQARACAGKLDKRLVKTDVALAVPNTNIKKFLDAHVIEEPDWPKSTAAKAAVIIPGVDFLLVSKENEDDPPPRVAGAPAWTPPTFYHMWDHIMRNHTVITQRPFQMRTMAVQTYDSFLAWESCCKANTCIDGYKEDLYLVATKETTISIRRVAFPDDENMRKSVDHSKWGINAVRKNSDPTIPAESVFPTVCFGDLNRHHNQNNRGGTTTCLNHEALWRAMSLEIEWIDYCAEEVPRVVPRVLPLSHAKAGLATASMPPGASDWTFDSARKREEGEERLCADDSDVDHSPYPCLRPRILYDIYDVDADEQEPTPFRSVFMYLPPSFNKRPTLIHNFGLKVTTTLEEPDDLEAPQLPNPLFWAYYTYFVDTTHYAWQIFSFGPGSYGALVVNNEGIRAGGLLYLHNSVRLHMYWHKFDRPAKWLSSPCGATLIGRELGIDEAKLVSSLIYQAGAIIRREWMPGWMSDIVDQFPSFDLHAQTSGPLPTQQLDLPAVFESPRQTLILSSPTTANVIERVEAVLGVPPGVVVVKQRKQSDPINYVQSTDPSMPSYYFAWAPGAETVIVCDLPTHSATLASQRRGVVTICTYLDKNTAVAKLYIGGFTATQLVAPVNIASGQDRLAHNENMRRSDDDASDYDTSDTEPYIEDSEEEDNPDSDQPASSCATQNGGGNSKRAISSEGEPALCDICQACCTGDQIVSPVLPPKCLTTSYPWSSNEGFFLYKLPSQSSGPEELLNGTAYLLSEAGSQLTAGQYSLTWKNSPIERTLRQFELSSLPYSIIAYHSDDESEGGLGNGLIAIGSTSGIWLTHSRRPQLTSDFIQAVKEYDPSTAASWSCVPVDAHAVSDISKALALTKVRVYYSKVEEDVKNKFPSIKRLIDPAVLAVDTDPSSLFLETIPETLQRPEIRVAATSPASLLPIYPYLIQPMITESSMVVRGHGGGDSSCSSGVCELPLISPSSFMVDFRGNTVTWSAASDRAIWGVSCNSDWVCYADAVTSSSAWPIPAVDNYKQGSIGFCYRYPELAQSMRGISGVTCNL